MSPTIKSSSLRAPRRLGLRGRCGTSSATGLPFFVMTTATPVRATSSIRARHLALNSDALMWRVIGSCDSGQDHGHIAAGAVRSKRPVRHMIAEPGGAGSLERVPFDIDWGHNVANDKKLVLEDAA